MFSVSLGFIILLALVFDFINGFHDTANSIATSVSTRVLTPRQAIVMSASLNFLGAVTSVTVAETIAKGIVGGVVPQEVVIAALITAIIWDLLTWYIGIPSSSSHALIGSLIGAAIVIMSGGFGVVLWQNVMNKVIIPLLTSPLIGFVVGYIVMKALYFLLRFLSQKTVNKWFSKLQIVSAAFMAYSHGSNDAQKSMGIITMALVSAGLWAANKGIPLPVIVMCALSMALGTSIGGWKIIKTIGINMIKLQPVGGFAAETSAALIIHTMTMMGAPVSTTQVISTAIMGVGASKRLSAVRWSIAKSIVITWLVTIPSTMLMGAAVAFVLKIL